MPIYDYECQNCNYLELDVYASVDQEDSICPQCQGPSSRIISLSGVHTANEDAAWIRSITEVVDKDDKSRASQEFLKSPTRTNLKRFMDAKGIRHLENQHGGPPPAFDRSKQEVPTKKIEKAVWKEYRERNTLHVR